jgi:chemotaxis response regulator CheB
LIRVLVADDEAIVRDGLRVIIELADDLQVVAEAADGREAVDLARELTPDVAVLDIRMPRMDGIDATRRMMALPSPPRVLVLTTFDRNEYVYDAMPAGASYRSAELRTHESSRPRRGAGRKGRSKLLGVDGAMGRPRCSRPLLPCVRWSC